MAIVMKCTCKNEAQDKMHGKGNRVFNETAQTNPQVYRCTVCKTEKTR